eukprot:gene13497-9657_t
MSQLSSKSSKPSGRYLSTAAIRALASSMALVSSVLGFEIVEVWSEGEDNAFHCTYVHAEEGIVEKYPNIITGYFPQHKRKHLLSPSLCLYARRSPEHYHWRVIDPSNYPKSDTSSEASDASTVSVYELLSFPVRTEMAFELSGATFPIDMNLASTGDIAVDHYARGCFLVAISVERIEFKPYKLKFLSGLAVAIFVAAFDLDADDDRESIADANGDEGHGQSLLDDSGLDARDGHEGQERRFSSESGVPLPLLDFAALPLPPPLVASTDSGAHVHPVAAITSTSPPPLPVVSTAVVGAAASAASATMSATKRPFASSDAVANGAAAVEDEVGQGSDHDDQSASETQSQPNAAPQASPVPVWDPARSFHFPIKDIPVKDALDSIPRDLVLASTVVCGDFEYSFTDIAHVADGSHAHIFLASLHRTAVHSTATAAAAAADKGSRPLSSRSRVHSQRVVVKMMTENALRERVACQEFAIEFGTLARVQHPHIIRLLGAGHAPRPFLVLEHLAGGTLYKILDATQQTWGSASGLQRLFRKPSFTYTALLRTALALAEACEYLHYRVHPGAMILHRDLKPDNIGFTADGTLKLFDFGLSVCVKSRQSLDEAYEMTGYTGSLRYMAPEVVQRAPYTELCDVYSYAIVLWQMARDRIPFKGLTKEDFIQRVVKQQERPKLDRAWPAAFSSLLQRCWHADPKQRPKFTGVIAELRALIVQHEGGAFASSAPAVGAASAGAAGSSGGHASGGLYRSLGLTGGHAHGHDAHHGTHSGSTSGTSTPNWQHATTSVTSAPSSATNTPRATVGKSLTTDHLQTTAATHGASTPASGSGSGAGLVRRGRMIGGMGSAAPMPSGGQAKPSPATSSWF